MNSSLRPPDDLARPVGAGSVSIVASQRWKRAHHAIVPDEAETGVAGRAWEEGRATPPFSQRIEAGSFGDAHDEVVVVVWPSHRAVRTSECAEVECFSMRPKNCVLSRVARQVGRSAHPILVVNATGAARCAAERPESRQREAVLSVAFRFLRTELNRGG